MAVIAIVHPFAFSVEGTDGKIIKWDYDGLVWGFDRTYKELKQAKIRCAFKNVVLGFDRTYKELKQKGYSNVTME